MRKLICLLLVGTLVGCATTPKPELSEKSGQDFVYQFALIQQCGQQGLISPELSASGIRILNNDLSAYTYDSGKLNAQVGLLLADALPALPVGCNRMAIKIAERKQRIESTKQANLYNQQQEQVFINSTQSTQTYCNRIGAQTFCNTY